MSPPPPHSPPLVVAAEMGYGHLRAAWPLARALGVDLLRADEAPLADEAERRLWERMRGSYEAWSRASQYPVVGPPLRAALDWLTAIEPLHPARDLAKPNAGARIVERMAKKGLGRGLVARLKETGAPLLTTFFSTAIIADRAGCEVWCLVTDTDINRVWVALDPKASRIRYLAPTRRAARRLEAYGVPEERITFTGFPLPGELVGGRELVALRRNLAARLVRLDPARELRQELGDLLPWALGPLPREEEGRPPLVTFAVGGAGAQVRLTRAFLPSIAASLREGRLRLALVAGLRPEVVAKFRRRLEQSGLADFVGRGIEILEAASLDEYLTRFSELMARTDVLWSKPSEMAFYAALGLPVVCARPMGVHERYNERWLVENGAGLVQRDPHVAGEWLLEWLADGTLAGAAWAGFQRLPKLGLYRIVEAVGW